ncbi:MAG: bifunctional 5,10-methylenetetrahydrofolate dehydrogenase/5,10-methenyltetrahydrofolate cyclohydrolase [Thermoplasmata archaeon]|nr:bifunctional 5,10-methylenetetrahydrofolate dehydrogenase/5,10-methenyltetrahydrofolate cyclohydrolase [Thermoplasmata archaeon]
MSKHLLGQPVAERILEWARERIRARGDLRPPLLASVHTADDNAFSVYLGRQRQIATETGIQFRGVSLPEGVDSAKLATTLAALEADPAIDGIIVEHPLPTGIDFFSAMTGIRPAKDIDGISPASLGLLAARRPVHVPAVAKAVQEILKEYHIPVSGRRVAILGRSETVGVPLALLLLARGEAADATVTVAHSKTADLTAALAGAEIVVSCVGQPGLLTRAIIPEGSTVIDVGLSTVADASRPNGRKAVGDADPESLEGWSSAYTPVPGGVGPVTVALLMSNVVDAWEHGAAGGFS